MSATKKEVPAAAEPVGLPMTLDEWCRRKSITYRRPTALGGFYSHASRNGLVTALSSEFEAAFASFMTAKVSK